MRRWIRSLLGIVPTLDLHGLGVKEAVAAAERFLREASAEAEPVVRIVYGRGRHSPEGRGILRAVIPRWLDTEGASWVARYERQLDDRGEDAAVRVWLRRREDGPR